MSMIAILSDAHGHYKAFEKALDIISTFSTDKIIFLGDSIDYIPTQKVLLKLIEDKSIVCLRGNHEDMMLKGTAPKGKESVYHNDFISRSMQESHHLFMEQWPEFMDYTCPAGKCFFVHAGPGDYLNEYIYPDTDITDYSDFNYDYVFMGHTHRPFIRKEFGKVFVNVGSCGLPRDDGRFGSFCMFNTASGDARILRFNIERETRELMDEFPDIHESVKSVFLRRPEKLYGDII